MKYVVAFAGNPNVGKSAWINALSHADFKVGNWPGVTVEKKEAFVCWGDDEYHIIDLPGTHSLENSSNEENITARYLKETHVDLIVNVLDATSLASNLLLTLYLRELQIPMLMIFNFMDEVEKYHMEIDVRRISRRLQIDILPYSAFDTRHHETVRRSIMEHVGQAVFYYPLLSSDDEQRYVDLYNYIDEHLQVSVDEECMHRVVMNYLMHDSLSERQLSSWHLDMHVVEELRGGMNAQTLEHNRYQIIESLMQYVKTNRGERYRTSQKIDAILLHRFLGLPLFFIIFAFVLLFVFQMSAPFNDFIAWFIDDIVTRYIGAALVWTPKFLQELILNGIVAGVGGVLVFIPVMAFLYFMLSILEESGYMARISFLLDRAMRVFHLSGKSFVSLLLGFGCNVPAIYATRTLDNEKQKRLSAILIPFMSCGARLPVYVLFASAFFPHQAGVMILSVYGIGILMALLFALVFSRTSFMKDDAMYVQELPPYRMPSMRVVTHKVKEEVRGYVKKATGIVLWAMVILWGLSYFPEGDIQTSYIAQASRTLQPIFEPLGFGTRWESVASLPGGIIAKETIVGYFDQVLGENKEEVSYDLNPLEDAKAVVDHAYTTLKDSAQALFHPHVNLKPESNQQTHMIHSLWHDRFAKLRAFSFMVYVLLSIPCVMTLQALYHEYGLKLMLLSVATMLLVPYCVSFFLFQLFSLLL